MSITNVGTHYLIEGLLDHKEQIDIAGIPMYQAKDFENNLRERNPILGIVYGLSNDNPLKLTKEDTVICSHWAFCGEIGANKSYKVHDYVVVDNRKLFRVHPNDIFFTYNDKQPIPLGNILGVEKVEDIIDTFGITSTVEHKDRGRVIYPNCGLTVGTEVLLENHALYEITLDKKKFYRIRENEIVGIIHEEQPEIKWAEITEASYDGSEYRGNPLLWELMEKTAKVTGKKTVTPYKGKILVEDLYEPSENERLYPDVFFAPRDCDAKVIAVGEMTEKEKHENNHIQAGDKVFRVRNSGIRFGNQFLASLKDDTVHFIYEK